MLKFLAQAAIVNFNSTEVDFAEINIALNKNLLEQRTVAHMCTWLTELMINCAHQSVLLNLMVQVLKTAISLKTSWYIVTDIFENQILSVCGCPKVKISKK